jgi:ferredoxin-NADP reductase
MEHRTTLLFSEFVTHDVKRFVLERPRDFQFTPGQGVEIAIDLDGWRDEGRPFTPTSLPGDGVLEFTIKAYPEHNGVTQALHTLKSGDKLLMSSPFGTINYHGPGMFIAAGAGITPFLSILRMLQQQDALAGNSLLFSNKTPADIICEKELRHLLDDHVHFICTKTHDCTCQSGRINRSLMEQHVSDFTQHFYVCGPPPFVDAINSVLISLGATPDAMIFEH